MIAASSPVIARAPVVPRIAATLDRFQPSVIRMVTTVIPLAVRTASGTGGTPAMISGSRTLRITTAVSPSATSARTPCHPPMTMTATAPIRASVARPGRRQRSLTSM